MSYSRMGDDSDLYIYKTGNKDGELYVCSACRLNPPGEHWHEDVTIPTLEQLWEHIIEHMENGHKVLPNTLERVHREILQGRKNPTDEEKIKIYESVFHKISMCVTSMNNEKIRDIVSAIDSWSYAHRFGNGELGEDEVEANTLRALVALKEI